jgi:hypothetical protein
MLFKGIDGDVQYINMEEVVYVSLETVNVESENSSEVRELAKFSIDDKAKFYFDESAIEKLTNEQPVNFALVTMKNGKAAFINKNRIVHVGFYPQHQSVVVLLKTNKPEDFQFVTVTGTIDDVLASLELK